MSPRVKVKRVTRKKKMKRARIARRVRRPVKLDPETHDFFKTLKREISEAQNVDVSMGETIRRMRNIPETRGILIEDARAKRRMGIR